jgi:colanic acid/amylovoran biosynthesis glycosyltransferase
VTDILVYRDTIGARSEGFIHRQYRAFKQLDVLFVGTKRGPQAPKNSLALAAPGIFGALARFRFRQFGQIPGVLKKEIAKRKPALIHAQFGLGGALALPIARYADIPLVVTFHGGDATKDKHFAPRKLMPTIFQRRRNALADEAQAIFCVSQFVRDKLIARGFPLTKLQTHYLGIDIPPDVALPPLGTAKTVLFVGRLVEKKGVDVLIDAMAMVRATEQSLTLTIVGDGPLRTDLKRRAADAGVPAEFRGWLKPQEVQTAMRRALLLAVPSRTADGGDAEGLPTVIMEAMALGVPVIASRHAGIPEIIAHGVTGLLIPESDPPALAEAIFTIHRDHDLAARLRGEAYADVRARFDAERQSALLERHLLEIIARHGKSA